MGSHTSFIEIKTKKLATRKKSREIENVQATTARIWKIQTNWTRIL